ncbi:MAG: hypothetical protein CMQ53_03855 [Gammaproteobacteria bacterium]|nr:hypothetical protein [Gammaproteobacteria bacterium]|tara:strand:- start:272 stop:706 length:435 start_codon:yes stop_codon:yes gene_type:complete
MKKLLLIIFLSTPLFAEVKMTPLNEYLENSNQADPKTLLYVLSRCSAINFNLADITDDAKELQDRGLLDGQKYSQLAETLRQTIRKEDSSADNKRNNDNTINLFFNEYVKIMNVNYAKTGIYFTDWMRDDLSTCSALYEQSVNE